MKNFGLSTIVLFALAVFSFGQKTPTTWEEWEKQGSQQIKNNDYDGAMKSFSECIKLNSKAISCYYARAYGYKIKKNFDLAILDLNKVLAAAPDYFLALHDLAEIYNDSGKYDLAVSTATRLISLSPDSSQNSDDTAGFYFIRGLAYFNLKKYKEAIADQTTALRMGSQKFRGNHLGQQYLVRAISYCRIGEYELAVYDENKVSEFGGTVKNPCVEEDSLLAAGKDIDFEAIGDRVGAKLHIVNGLGAVVDRNFDKAIKSFTEAIKNAPKSPDGYYQRASAYHNYANNSQLAKADVEQALKLNPNHEEAMELKKQIEAKLGIASTISSATPAGTILFFDDFDDNRNNWALGNNDMAFGGIAGGRKTIEIKQQQYWRTTLGVNQVPNIDQTRDFLIETEITYHSGDDRHPYGLLWGVKDINNAFSFGIYPGSGKFYYGKVVGGSWNPIVSETTSPAVKTGIGATNKLGIRKRGDKIELYINDILVSTQKYESYSAPAGIGFNVDYPKKISADYFRITQYK